MDETLMLENLLAQAGWIPLELALSLRKAVGFRNLAVHNYSRINWDMVFVLCTDRLGDFEAFARCVLQALEPTAQDMARIHG